MSRLIVRRSAVDAPTAAIIVGMIASMAANVAHGLISKGGIGAVISGLFWPSALLLSIEVAVRGRWRHGPWWMILRLGATTPVAASAAIVSYLHMHGLLDHWDEHPLVCLIGPVGVDGLTTLGAALLFIQDRAQDRVPPPPGASQGGGQPSAGTHHWDASHGMSMQVGSDNAARQPVSVETLDKVLAALRVGEPMSTGQIAKTTRLGRSTASRAVSQLLADGVLMSTVGLDPSRPRDAHYSIAQQAPVGAS